VPYPISFVAETPGQDSCPGVSATKDIGLLSWHFCHKRYRIRQYHQSELHCTGAGLQILRFFPIFCFPSSQWVQHANECCTVERLDTGIACRLVTLSYAFATVRPSQSSCHRSLIHNVRNDWIGVMWR